MKHKPMRYWSWYPRAGKPGRPKHWRNIRWRTCTDR